MAIFKSIIVLFLITAFALNGSEGVTRKRKIEFPILYSDGRDIPSVPTPEDPDGDGVIGAAGRDYPILEQVPPTSFTCSDKLPGIYADMETDCQAYHVCHADERKESSLCVNGTLFNQATMNCDWWFRVSCEISSSFYAINSRLYKPSNEKLRHAYHPHAPMIIEPSSDHFLPMSKHRNPPALMTFPDPTVQDPVFIERLPQRLSKKPISFQGEDLGQKVKDRVRPRPWRPMQDIGSLRPEGFRIRDAEHPAKRFGSTKKSRKRPSSRPSSSRSNPQMQPVKSEDQVHGFSDLYEGKSIDSD